MEKLEFSAGQSLLEILHAESPAEAKKIGRKVFPFQKEIWQRHRYAVLYEQVSSAASLSRSSAKDW